MGTVGFKIQEIAHKYGLKLLVYFGSYGTEFYGDDSDIDIAYLAEDPLSIHEKMNLLRDLIIVHRKSEIDLVDLQTAEPVLRYVIATKGRTVFEQEEGLFERYALYYVKRMYELRPIIEEDMRHLMKEIRELNMDE